MQIAKYKQLMVSWYTFQDKNWSTKIIQKYKLLAEIKKNLKKK